MKKDIDPQETREWLASLASVLREEGEERAHFIIETLLEQASRDGLGFTSGFTTPYYNTIPAERQPAYPGDLALEKRIEAFVRCRQARECRRSHRQFFVFGRDV